MKLNVENLGPINKGTIDLEKALTILTGPNNSGKSYLTYLLHSFISHEYIFGVNKFRRQAEDHFKEITELRKEIESESRIDIKKYIHNNLGAISRIISNIIKSDLTNIFASSSINPEIETIFDEVNLSNHEESYAFFQPVGNDVHMIRNNNKIDKEFLQSGKIYNNPRLNAHDKITTALSFFSIIILHNNLGARTFFFPAERTAINLFARHITSTKAKIKDELDIEAIAGISAEELGNRILRQIRTAPKYPYAIRSYIDFVNNFKKKDIESEFSSIAISIEEKILGGKVHVDELDQVLFTPNQSSAPLELHLTSSLVKSLSYLALYLRYEAAEEDMIIIDEPELNLHPNLQVAIAKIIAEIANAGLKIIISTHSDYLIKELNNLVLLHKLSKDENNDVFIAENGYNQEHLLDSKKVGAYFLDDNTIKEIDIEANGLEVPSINDTIIKVDSLAEELFLKLESQS